MVADKTEKEKPIQEASKREKVETKRYLGEIKRDTSGTKRYLGKIKKRYSRNEKRS